MSRNDKVGRTATTITTDETGTTHVQYHATRVVSFNPDEIVLRSGGYETVTTKRRINQASNQFGLKIGIFQKSHKWFVTTTAGTFDFFDGIVIDRLTGRPIRTS
jgi:hypothetical protein